ncbi:hypothetical protein [Frateuria sp. YIM B11624]|uniref:hypothetical protein n=1 Tax=Frateuria sp. YIM B11624 TaxID=3143185 RepID=UPI003C783FA8
MKLTLDHNVLIDLANGSANVVRLRESLATKQHEGFVVEIGASEMRQRGIKPDRYDLFERLLEEAGVASLPRLAPMMIWDVTFWDHDVWSDECMANHAKQIEDILFGDSPPLAITGEPDTSPKFAAWLNRLCDVQTMWCHLHYANDAFVTSDRNFHKATKAPRLLALGAGKILRPEAL